MVDNIGFGKKAEDLALRLLERRGWKLVDRHVCFREGEIDLIVEKDGGLLFVEVKGRRSSAFGDVVEALTTGKTRRLRKVVIRWRERSGDGRRGRLYFVGILFEREKPVKVIGHLIE